MSSQKGNIAKKGPPKHQNKTAWKNVYHDTSKKSKQIASTEVSGVCRRCKDVIDWKIKYKKYKLLTQPKTCVTCKEKTVRNSYHVYCIPCAGKANKCAKCGESKEIVTEPSKTAAQEASEDHQLQYELDLLPERKRRTFLRLQEQGKLTKEALSRLEGDHDEFDDDDDDDDDLIDNADDDDDLIDNADDDDDLIDNADDDDDIRQGMAGCAISDVSNNEHGKDGDIKTCKDEMTFTDIKPFNAVDNRLVTENSDFKNDELLGCINSVDEPKGGSFDSSEVDIREAEDLGKNMRDNAAEENKSISSENDRENDNEEKAEETEADIPNS